MSSSELPQTECKWCGGALLERAETCPRCGRLVASSARGQARGPSTDRPSARRSAARRLSPRRVKRLGLIVVGALLLVAWIATRPPTSVLVLHGAALASESAAFRDSGDTMVVAIAAGGERVAAVADLPEGPRSKSSAVRAWEIATGEQLLSLTYGSPLGSTDSAALNHARSTLACGYLNGSVLLWDLQTGTGSTAFTAKHTVKALCYSPDDSLLAVADAGGQVTVWDVAAATPRATLQASRDYAFAVAFSPDGRTLATGGDYDGRIRLWDTRSWRQRRTLRGHSNSVDGLAFSGDGRWLASGSWDGTAKLWSARWGRLVRTFAGHSTNVWFLAFSPDSKLLATVSSEAVLWTVPDGACKLVLPVDDPGTAAFSADGLTLATPDGSRVKLWDISAAYGK